MSIRKESVLTDEELTRMAFLLKKAFAQAADSYEDSLQSSYRNKSGAESQAKHLAAVSQAYMRAAEEMEKRGI